MSWRVVIWSCKCVDAQASCPCQLQSSFRREQLSFLKSSSMYLVSFKRASLSLNDSNQKGAFVL
jgi:hypothetical protein